MFEAAQLGRKLSKREFKELEPELHTRLLEVQRLLRESDRSVVLVVSGVEGAGKGNVVNRLNKWHPINQFLPRKRPQPLIWWVLSAANPLKHK